MNISAKSPLNTMRMSCALAVLLCVFQVSMCQKQCDLNVPQAKQTKFISMVKGWFGSLKNNVQTSQSVDCKDCEAIRPKGQKDVASEKDSKTGCRCEVTDNNDKFQCVCCFKLKKWNYLICNSAGFTLGSKEVFLVVTVEDQVIVEAHVSLEAWWAQLLAKLLSCIPLPPPVAFLSICFKPSLEKPSAANNNSWVLCIQLKIGILLVPVISIKPKCFQIGGKKQEARKISLKPEWMKLQGQSDPKEEVADPAKSTVIDDNFNGMVCLLNTKKAEAGACPTGTKGCGPPTVEQASKINWKHSEPGETPFLAVLHQGKFPKPTDEVHGDDNKYPYISSALQRASEEKWMNQADPVTLELPGRTCGGALLTSNKVLTICACVRSFYFLHYMEKDPGEDIIDNPFDIQSADIYVEFSGVTFSTAEEHRLVKDKKRFMSKSNCAKYMERGDTWTLQTTTIVMAFEPEIKNPKPRQFVPWPPLHQVKADLEVNLVGFGMEPVNQTWLFKSPSGEVMDFDKNSVDIFMKACKLTEYTKTELQKEPHVSLSRVSGFCSSDPAFQLCYGKIGLPVTTGKKHRQLVGLSSIPIDCTKEGSVAGTIFDTETIHEIDNYLAGAYAVYPWIWLHLLCRLLHGVM